jgi:hypothetical protein
MSVTSAQSPRLVASYIHAITVYEFGENQKKEDTKVAQLLDSVFGVADA